MDERNCWKIDALTDRISSSILQMEISMEYEKTRRKVKFDETVVLLDTISVDRFENGIVPRTIRKIF